MAGVRALVVPAMTGFKLGLLIQVDCSGKRDFEMKTAPTGWILGGIDAHHFPHIRG